MNAVWNLVSTIALHPIALVGAGGAIGANLRFALGAMIAHWLRVGDFPIGTLIINLVGSFVLGLVVGYSNDQSNTLLLFGGIGICGGFTTFSTFSKELTDLMLDGRYGIGLMYALVSINLGVSAYWLGLRCMTGLTPGS